MHRSLPLFLLALAAGSDQGLTAYSPDEPLGADTAAPSDTDPDTATPEPDCATFTFRWEAPFDAALALRGELRGADGAVTVAWMEWASTSGHTIEQSWTICDAFGFRGQGSSDANGDGAPETWSCMNQGEDGAFALVGVPECSLDGSPMPIETLDAPGSEGCELWCADGVPAPW